MSVIVPVDVEECLWSPSPLAATGRDGADNVLIVCGWDDAIPRLFASFGVSYYC
jgi:hypothetical protein